MDRGYSLRMDMGLYLRIKEAAKSEGKTIRFFILEACRAKCEQVENKRITKPWIPRV